MDLNSDMGKSFGLWRMGDDVAMLEIVSSANIACGFHAGDPSGMLATLRRAAASGVAVGAHVGYRDLAGFGRRAMDIAPADLTAEVIYQIGALDALARAAGTRVSYVKPHGALYHTTAHGGPLAWAVIDALHAIGGGLALLVLAGSPMVGLAQAAGLSVIGEVVADRTYQPDGQLVPRGQPGALIQDPDLIALRMLRLVRDGVIADSEGGDIRIEAQSIGLCGDDPGAVQIARRIRALLSAEGVPIAPSRPACAKPG